MSADFEASQSDVTRSFSRSYEGHSTTFRRLRWIRLPARASARSRPFRANRTYSIITCNSPAAERFQRNIEPSSLPIPIVSPRCKCSGTYRCDNCVAYGRECVFDETKDQRRRVAAKHTAEELVYFQDSLFGLMRVVQAEDESYGRTLFRCIRKGTPLNDIRQLIRTTLLGMETNQPYSITFEGSPFRPQVMDLSYLCEAPYLVPAEPWTSVTRDSDLVSHLVSLYFTWDYPSHVFLNRDVFIRHMKAGDTSSELCSPFLVNALLANACHYSEISEVFKQRQPGDIMTKGDDFLAEAERLGTQGPATFTLAHLQGTLMLYEKYSLSGKDDLGYIMLHRAINIGKSMGLVGQSGVNPIPGHISSDMEESLKRTAWGLFHIDTPCVVRQVNLPRPIISAEEREWKQYPYFKDARSSYFDEYFAKSWDLCEIACDMSQRLFTVDDDDVNPKEQKEEKDDIDRKLCEWYEGLDEKVSFSDPLRCPPPYVLIMGMRYYTLIIILLLYKAEVETVNDVSDAMITPDSPVGSGAFKEIVPPYERVQNAARAIAGLARMHQRAYHLTRVHHFAVYAINLALFVMLDLSRDFDIQDDDFLFLACAFGNIATRSHVGRNLFHLFREQVQSKRQGSQIRESDRVTDVVKDVFDENFTESLQFDVCAKGLEKLMDERYRAIAKCHPLCNMLDKYECLSLGRDELAPERDLDHVMDDSFHSHSSAYNNAASNHNVDSNMSPNQGTLSQSSSSDWMWRAGSISSNSAPMTMNYQLYPFTPYPDLNATQHPHFPPPQDTMTAPKIAIPRATSAKTSSQRRRSARACEPCRQRKVKCDGGRPECRKCREHGLGCSYIDIKRIRDQKQLGVLSRKVERYEKLLRQLENDLDPGTTKRIRKALSAAEQSPSDGDGDADAEGADDGSDADSSTSHGSLEEIDLVKEDLNRSDKSVAMGFYGKNSEVAWMQKLEDVSGQRAEHGDFDVEKKASGRQVPMMSMSYHLDDLMLPFSDSVDPFAMPPKRLADKYFHAYMRSVHPAFMVVRENTFTSQYEQFFTKKFVNPPRKWLAVLNMIFALGCRFCKLTGEVKAGDAHTDDLAFLNRTRRLCLGENVLFDHDDLQQIQVELLVAFHLVALGQVNSASKFSSMALRSAISLGINLRFKDDKTHHASKEARCRLWWSIFLLEHLLTSITGRISGCGEGLSAALLPVPFDERGGDRRSSLDNIFHDAALQASRLQLTIYQNDEEAQIARDWLVRCEPSPMLLFHYIADLSIIGQTVINSVYSIQGLRQTPRQLEQRLQKQSKSLDLWLRKIPEAYRFSLSTTDDRFHIEPGAGYVRERITLAIYYYSARITLCRPCLSHTPNSLQKARDSKSKSGFRATMTLSCLQASCSLLSILPERPNTVWLTTVTPWWAILHYIMQATTALLIGLSTCATSDQETNTDDQNKVPSLKREMLVNETRKAFFWLHHLAFSSRAARRAFMICEGFLGRMGPSLGIDISELPSSETLPPQGEDIDMSESGLAMVDDG
ncbi:hypothetical protein BJY00DRAFT_301573 [Aspergillus carlsbadensis]|nr:hypothetical protein BJY00DRAFT_301573 [Aspergillus carlsbadensis]